MPLGSLRGVSARDTPGAPLPGVWMDTGWMLCWIPSSPDALPSVVPACFCPSSGYTAASSPAWPFARCSWTGVLLGLFESLACLRATCDLHWVWRAAEWLRLEDRSDTFFQSSGTSPDHHDLPEIIRSGFAVKSASSLMISFPGLVYVQFI